MNFLKYLVYGFVSGFSELIPVSGLAHQQLLQYLFGIGTRESFLDFLVHISVILAVIVGNYPAISRIRRENKLTTRRRGKKHLQDSKNAYDMRIVKTAAVPMLLGMLLYKFRAEQTFNLVTIMIASIVMAAVGLTVDYMRQGNKDSRHISALDAIGMGLGCTLAAIPGFSRVGMAISVTVARGADRGHAYNWALLLSIPALVLMAAFDLISIFTFGAGIAGFGMFLVYMVTAIFAFAGGYCAITFVNNLAVRTGFSGIAYYNLGVGLFSFVLYLIT